MKKIIKTIIKSIIGLFIILIILGSSLFIVSQLYQDTLTKYMIEEINREINVKISIRSADVSVFRKFPFLSVVLKDVVALSPSGYEKEQFKSAITDTLFSVSRLYLQFNIIDLIQKNYRLRRAQAVEGKVTLLTDKFGQVNYRIFKVQEKSSENPSSLYLDGVRIKGIQLIYINLSKNINAGGRLHDISMKGRFSSNEYKLSLSGSIMFDSIRSNDIKFSEKTEADMKIQMAVKDTLYEITKGDLNLNNMNFQLTGAMTLGELTNLDLKLGANRIDIKSFVTVLPVDMNNINHYKPTGNMDILARITGRLSRIHVPDIRVAFAFTRAKLFIPKYNYLLEGLNLKGTFSNGVLHSPASTIIKINEYDFIVGKTKLHGNFTMENLSKPFISAGVSGHIDAKFFSEVLNIKALRIDRGFIKPQITLTTKIKDLEAFHSNKILSASMEGNLQVEGISGFIPGLAEYIDQLEGKIKIEGDTWFSELRARSKESDITFDGEAQDVLGSLLFKKTYLKLEGKVYSHYINLRRFINNEEVRDTGKFILPERLSMNFNYSADSLIYGKFKAENISTNISCRNGEFYITSLDMKTLKGKIRADGILTQKENGDMVIKSQSIVDKVDINETFYVFNNFTQKFIVAENLRGSLSGNIGISLSINNDFNPYYSTLILDSDVSIINGELINFEPIKQLSRYISLTELEHIKFSSLQNVIAVQNSKVYIPKMDINSSAFNITASGIHDFDNYFEYKVKVNLSEILAGKARKAKKENEEFGMIEKDGSGGTSLHLAITGNPDDFKVRYDKKESLTQIKTDIQKEKKTLKSIFKEEFGSKKDTSFTKKSTQTTQDRLILDWGDKEDGQKMEKRPDDKPDKLKKSDLKFEW